MSPIRTFAAPAALALALALVGCSDPRLQAGPDAFVPDEPAQEEEPVEDENEDEQDEQDDNEDEQDDNEDEQDDNEDEQDEDEEEEALEADDDFDTFDDPLFVETFLGSGRPRIFAVADAISAPGGDPNDWVEFTTPALQNERVNITLDLGCEGTGGAVARLYSIEDGLQSLGAAARVRCGQSDRFLLDTNTDYLVRVQYEDASLQYDAWDLEVSW